MKPAPAGAGADCTLLLPDGRRLGYADYGTPDGRPVLYFHGAPGSHHELTADMIAQAQARSLRLLAPERPGYGWSDPHPGRSLHDWCTDVAALADALGITRFSIVGQSMGGVYALACAQALPARVDRLALCGGLAPLDAPGVTQGMAPQVSGLLAMAQNDPDGLRAALQTLAQTPSALLAAMAEFMPESDQAVIQRHIAALENNFSHALRQGVEGAVSDWRLLVGPWGFSPAQIRTEVHLWQGDQDCNAPPAMSAYLASVLTKHKLFMLPGLGHMALYRHWDDILEQLLGP